MLPINRWGIKQPSKKLVTKADNKYTSEKKTRNPGLKAKFFQISWGLRQKAVKTSLFGSLVTTPN